MKSFYVFMFLCSPLFFLAQSSNHLVNPDLPENFHQLLLDKHNESAFSQEVTVLDSQLNYVTLQGGKTFYHYYSYTYNNQAQLLEQRAGSFYGIVNDFQISSKLNYSYTPFQEYWTIGYSRATPDIHVDPNPPLLLSQKTTYEYTEDDLSKKIYYFREKWNKDQNKYYPDKEEILIKETALVQEWDVHLWALFDPSNLIRKKKFITHYHTDSTITDFYNLDTLTQTLIPFHRHKYCRYNNGLNFIYSKSYSWNEVSKSWELYRSVEEFREPGADFAYILLKFSSNGNPLTVRDSIVIHYGNDNLRDIDSTFSVMPNTGDLLLSGAKIYHYEDNLIQLRENFHTENNKLEKHTEIHYRYSTIDKTSSDQQAVELPFTVKVENPTKDITVYLEGDPIGEDIYLDLHDINGRLVDRKRAELNESNPLGDADMIPGVYLLTIQYGEQHYQQKLIKK